MFNFIYLLNFIYLSFCVHSFFPNLEVRPQPRDGPLVKRDLFAQRGRDDLWGDFIAEDVVGRIADLRPNRKLTRARLAPAYKGWSYFEPSLR